MRIYEPRPGENIEMTCKVLEVLCYLHSEPVKAIYNDVVIIAKPGMTANDVMQLWIKSDENKELKNER